MDFEGMFDESGRLTPGPGERVYDTSDRGYFCLTQPIYDIDDVLTSISRYTGSAGESRVPDMSERLIKVRQAIEADPLLAGIFAGVHVPFFLPKFSGAFGAEFEEHLLSSVRAAYLQRFPAQQFRDFNSISMSGNAEIVPDSRWELLTTAREADAICGWYFPTALAGYAIPDQRTLMGRLPSSFVLSGPSEAAAALIGCPELLYKDDGKYGKLLALSAVTPASADQRHFFWYFESYGWDLDFNVRSMVGAVSEYYSGGITILA